MTNKVNVRINKLESVSIDCLPDDIQEKISIEVDAESWDAIVYQPVTKSIKYYDADYLADLFDLQLHLAQRGYKRVIL
jgi:hypothetical protein